MLINTKNIPPSALSLSPMDTLPFDALELSLSSLDLRSLECCVHTNKKLGSATLLHTNIQTRKKLDVLLDVLIEKSPNAQVKQKLQAIKDSLKTRFPDPKSLTELAQTSSEKRFDRRSECLSLENLKTQILPIREELLEVLVTLDYKMLKRLTLSAPPYFCENLPQIAALRKTLPLIEEIEASNSRNQAFKKTLKALAKAGDLAKLKELLPKSQNPNEICVILAEEYAKQGSATAVETLINKINATQDRNKTQQSRLATAQLCLALARSGQASNAILLYQDVFINTLELESLLFPLLVHLEKFEELKKAHEESPFKDPVLRLICKEFLQQEELEKATYFIAEITDPRYLPEILETFVEIGRKEEALKRLAELTNPWAHFFAQKKIVLALIQKGFAEEAMELALSLKNLKTSPSSQLDEQQQALEKIGLLFAKKGHLEKAEKIRDLIQDPISKGSLNRALFLGYTQRKEMEKAISFINVFGQEGTFKAERDDPSLGVFLKEHLRDLFSPEDTGTHWLSLVMSLDPYFRNIGLQEFYLIMGKRKLTEKALNLLEDPQYQIAEEPYRSTALTAIAQALVDQGRFQEADALHAKYPLSTDHALCLCRSQIFFFSTSPETLEMAFQKLGEIEDENLEFKIEFFAEICYDYLLREGFDQTFLLIQERRIPGIPLDEENRDFVRTALTRLLSENSHFDLAKKMIPSIQDTESKDECLSYLHHWILASLTRKK